MQKVWRNFWNNWLKVEGALEENWLKVGGALLCHQLMEQGSSNVLPYIVLHKLTEMGKADLYMVQNYVELTKFNTNISNH